MHNCQANAVQGTKACQQHALEWQQHQKHWTRSTYSGVQRMLQHPNEGFEWQQNSSSYTHPHEQPQPLTGRKNYFTPGCYYCVETICAPCGTVIAWAKFDKAESPTNILNFLEVVYPTEESRPQYICIDKACLVLRTAISNGKWDSIWANTSHFIVDTYHYTNHKASDILCRTYCNPAPTDGSAPNLVVLGSR